MRLKLKSDSYFTVGTGAQPVDLVSKSSRDRIALNEDEAAVAMLLMEGAPAGDELVQLVQSHGVRWDLATLETYLGKLEAARLLARGQRHRLAPTTADVEALDVLALDASYDTDPGSFDEQTGERTDAEADEAPGDVTDITDIDDAELDGLDEIEGEATRVDMPDDLAAMLADGEDASPATVPEVPVAMPPVTMPPAAMPPAAMAPVAMPPAAMPPAIPVPPLRADLEARSLPDGTVLLCDPLSGIQQRLARDVLQLASLFDGVHDIEQVVLAARRAGINVSVQTARTVAERLAAKGLLGDAPLLTGPMPVPGARGLADDAPPLTGPMPITPQLRAASIQPAAAPAQGPGVESATLATALVLMRDNRYAEAQAAIQPVLERNPDNAQAATLLHLIQTEAARDQTRRRKKRVVRLVIGGAVALCLLTALFVPVPRRLAVPCTARTLPVGAVTAPSSGKLTRMAVVGQVVNKGQEIAQILDEEATRAAPALRQRIADDKDLLRVMRTGGTDDDASSARKAVKRFERQIEETDCSDEPCRRRLEALKQRLATAKRKVKYCDWKAFDDEVQAMTKQIGQLEARLAELAKRSKVRLSSPTRGLISEVHPTDAIGKGAKVVQLVDAGRFEVEAVVSGDLPAAGAQVELTLVRGSARQSYLGKVSGRQPGKVRTTIETDVSKLLLGGSCEARMTAGRILLIQSLLR